MGPDFLGIGAQKAGTKWLYDQLLKHPGLSLPPIKEIHYWDVYRKLKASGKSGFPSRFFQRKWQRHLGKALNGEQTFDFKWHSKFFLGSYSDAWYSSLFAESNGQLTGEITPEYGQLAVEDIQAIRRMNPDLKMIYLLRDPVSRAWSSLLMYIRRSKLKFEEMEEKEVFAYLGSKDCIGKGDYVSCLKNWYSVYPEEQFYIGFMEQMKEQPQYLVNSICQHLGVSESEINIDGASSKPSHAGQKIDMTEQYRDFLVEKYFHHNEELYQMTGSSFVREWNRK